MKAVYAVAPLVLLVLVGPVQAQPAPENMDFEAGIPGAPPPGWRLNSQPQGASSFVTMTEKPEGGRQSGLLTAKNAGTMTGAAKTIDATPYRGKLILLRAALRGAGTLNLRSDAAPGRPLRLTSTPANATGWRFFQVIMPVSPQAASLGLTAVLRSPGTLGIDSVSLRSITPQEAGFTPPHALSARGLANLAAFTRLLGDVRFYHPSDQAAATDWDAFAIAGVQRVEKARNAVELARILTSLFAPVAPTLFVAAGDPPPPALPSCASCDSVGWRHTGVSLGTANPIYKSERVTRAPATAYLADLGGGVQARIPLTLPRDADGTLPHGSPPRQDFGKPALFVPSGDDRATRLAAIALTWTVFQHFYPYFDVVKTDWDGELTAGLRRAATDPDADAFEATLRRLVAALKDGHGDVIGTRMIYQMPFVWTVLENRLAVTQTDNALGLKAGDVIRTIGGQDAMTMVRNAEALAPAATPQWRQIKALRLLTPRDGAPVTLAGTHADGSSFTVNVTPRLLTGPNMENRTETLTEMRPGIWYVNLGRATDADLGEAALARLAMARAVIFDMRAYPTARASTIGRMLAHFATKDVRGCRCAIPVTTMPDRHAVTYTENTDFVSPPLAPRFPGKAIFLTGPQAVSGAESIMAMAEGGKLGPIVGETTAGTNGNLHNFLLPGGYTVSWTAMRVLKQDGSPHHGVGIAPDYPVTRTLAALAEGRDDVLEKALEIAMKEIAQ